MKKTGIWNYLKTQCLRYMQSLPGLLGITVLSFCLLLCILGLMLWQRGNSQEHTRAKIGIVGDSDGSYLGFGIEAVESMDPSRYEVELISLSEQDARDMLSTGEIVCYVVLPQGFVDSVTAGNNPEIQMVSNGIHGVTAVVTGSLTQVISDYLLDSQTSIYATQRLSWDLGDTSAYGETADRYFLRLLGYLVGRDRLMEVIEIGYGASVSYVTYYIYAVLLLLMLLGGLSSFSIQGNKYRDVSRCMLGRNISLFSQYLAESAALFLYEILLLICLTILLVVTFALLPDSSRQLLGLQGSFPLRFLDLLRFLPVIFVFGSIQKLIFESIDNAVTSLLLQFFVIIGMGYVCGLFYPLSFFPKAIQVIGAVLPIGAGLSFVQGGGVLFGFLLALYGAVGIWLGCRIKRRKLQ